MKIKNSKERKNKKQFFIWAGLVLILMPAVFLGWEIKNVKATLWDVTTAVKTDNELYVGSQNASPQSMAFSSDGLHIYMGSFYSHVYQYDLTTAWDISTASYTGKVADISGSQYGTVDTRGLSEIEISPNGTVLFALQFYNRTMYQFNLATPFDISTLSYSGNSFYVSQGQNDYGFGMKPDGGKAYIFSDYDDKIFQYTLATPWDLSTISYDSVYKSITYSIDLSPFNNL